MGRRKSFLSALIIERAAISHNCRFNNGHRIVRGHARLTAKEGRSKLRYCAACAISFMRADIEVLESKIKELERISVVVGDQSDGRFLE